MKASELLEADDLRRRTDFMECAVSLRINRTDGAQVISFSGDNEKRLRALQFVSAFEFGKRAI